MGLSEYRRKLPIIQNEDDNNNENDDLVIGSSFFLRWRRGDKSPNWKELGEVLVAVGTAGAFATGMALLWKWIFKWLQ